MSKEIKLKSPVSEEEIRKLKVGDNVLISGTIVTGRDVVHKYLVEKKPQDMKTILKDVFLYHCGPVMKKTKTGWEAVAAGPTTSIREEPYTETVIAEYKIKGIIGKGGMGEKTLSACKKFGCVYLHATGGAAALLANCIKKVPAVYKLEEFGMPEAFWVYEVEDFPAVVTMDSQGNSLHQEIEEKSKEKAKEIFKS